MSAVIEVHDLSKSYGQMQAIDGISFNWRRTAFTASSAATARERRR